MHPAARKLVVVTIALIFLSAAANSQLTQSPAKVPENPAATSSAAQAMQFSDQPNFSVAGVTDWTAVGGHGSDSTLRTTESLASATAALKSDSATASATSPKAAGEADALRASGERFEASGDALSAVHAFQQAATLDPSESNYFALGSELLLHRAIWQAEEVFSKGVAAFPKSARMQTAFGTALFAGARYEEAAQRLCAASDLDPQAAEPYLFMGKMQIVAPNPLTCIEPHLARFVTQQSGNPIANYLYAMTLLKSQELHPDPTISQRAQALLKKAVTLDPHCGDAYLQLGILAAAQHNISEAIRYYSNAITATPTLADAHYRLGVLYDRIGEHEKAKQEFKLHDQITQQQAALTENQRREIKQFIFDKSDVPANVTQP